VRFLVACIALLSVASAFPQAPGQSAAPPKVLLFFALNVEAGHMLFATDALRFFAETGDKYDFRVEATSNRADMNDDNLKQYKLVVWLNGAPPRRSRPPFNGTWKMADPGWAFASPPTTTGTRAGLGLRNSSAAGPSASTTGRRFLRI
jgi:hypothetical protein